MPHISEHQQVLQALQQTSQNLQLAQYLELVQMVLDDSSGSEADSNSDTSSDASMDSQDSHPSATSFDTSMTLDSVLGDMPSSDSDVLEPMFSSCIFLEFSNTVQALHDEVEKSCTLSSRPKATHAPQLHLLEEWSLENLRKFRHKLRVDPDIFIELVNKIIHHPIFYNNSNNPQLPVPVQLAIFLNAAGHYGNAATAEDMAEWAGVSVGTVYNCYQRVMIAILQHHDDAIHFDPLDAEDQIEKDQAKDWVEERTCQEWHGEFLCMDGTPFNLFQKPGWHGEGFFDRKSNYSLSAQVNNMKYTKFHTNFVCRS